MTLAVILVSMYDHGDLTDHEKGKTRISAGEVGMFVREFRVPMADAYVGFDPGYWTFDVYLFGDRLLQIKKTHANNILSRLKSNVK